MEIYKLLDLVYTEEEEQTCFVGTYEECQKFIQEQGGATFTYKIVSLTKEEIELRKKHNK